MLDSVSNERVAKVSYLQRRPPVYYLVRRHPGTELTNIPTFVITAHPKMKNSTRHILPSGLLAFVAFLVTFPKFVPEFGPGLDPSYVWALNYLVNFDYQALTGLVYPIGPLGFLKYAAALENNLAYALIFFSLVKWLFLALLFILGDEEQQEIQYVLQFVFILVIAAFTGIDFALIGSVVVLLILSIRKRQGYLTFFAANLLAAIGLMIKSSIGLASYSAIAVSYLIVVFSPGFRFRRLSFFALISLFVFGTTGLIIFKDLSLFVAFLKGMRMLAGAYAEGLSLYPENNWWYLSGFIISVGLLPLMVKSKKEIQAFSLLLLPLFAMWKHAMGREDIYHAYPLIGFLIVFWGIQFLNAARRKYLILTFAVISIGFYFLNLRTLPGYFGLHPAMNGLTHFNEAVLNYNAFKKESKFRSLERIRVNRLNDRLLVAFGKERVDVYPWDLSTLPANDLRWKPRKTLELGASTSAPLSRIAAQNYAGPTAPGFVIVHLKNDKWGGSFGTLDGRYLLNDEPQVIFNWLSNYRLFEKTDNRIFLEKGSSVTWKSSETSDSVANWLTWLPVPERNNGAIQRLKFKSTASFLGLIKSFLYKGEAFFIDYRFDDGKILTYRFLASNAMDGLWINPFILQPDKNFTEPQVTEIRFRCSNYSMVDDQITLNWQYLWGEGTDLTEYVFGSGTSATQQVFKTYLHDFEKGNQNKDPVDRAFRGAQAEKVGPATFSSSLKIDLEELWQNGESTVDVEVDLFYHITDMGNGKVNLILTLDETKASDWQAFSLSTGDLPDDWKYARLTKTLTREMHETGALKAYVWNNGTGTVIIDDFRMVIAKN